MMSTSLCAAHSFYSPVRIFLLCLFVATIISCGHAPLPPVAVAVTDTPATTFTVVLAHDDRLPFPSDADIRGALDLAAGMIDSWYHVRTEFRVTKSVDVDSYVMSYLGNMKIPEQWYEGRYGFERDDNIQRFESGLDENEISNLFSAHNLRQLLSDSEIRIVSRKRDNRAGLLKIFQSRLRTWQNEQLPDGSWLIDRNRWQKHSLWFWDLILRLVVPERVADNVIIMNTPLIDDDLASAPPHTLNRGGITKGYAKFEGGQVLISTFPIYSHLPCIASQRYGALSDTERILSLAIVIGHEVGAHLVQKWNDSYGHTGCLAEPSRDFNFHERLRRLFEFPRCTLNHGALNVNQMLAGRFYVLAVCRLEAGDTDGAVAAARRGVRADPQNTSNAEMLLNLHAKKNASAE